MSQSEINDLMEIRRDIIAGDILTALAAITEILYRKEVQSLGDVGRLVWVFGQGMGVITKVIYQPETSYEVFVYKKKQTFSCLAGDFRYAY